MSPSKKTIETTSYSTKTALSISPETTRSDVRRHVWILLSCLAITALVGGVFYSRTSASISPDYGNAHRPERHHHDYHFVKSKQQQHQPSATQDDRQHQAAIVSRSKRSPLVSSSSSFVEGSTGAASLYLINRYNEMNEESALNDVHDSGHCRKRSLSMCAGQVPFNSTTYPNFIGDENEVEASRSLPYFNYIAKSRCNKRIKQLLCSFLEPECQNGRPIPPCKKFCRIALEGCAEFVPQTLELSAAFDCRRYPDSTDPRVCTNLAIGPKCAADEFQCPDRSCIPRHWVCDGVRDCIFAADEANCNTVACSSEEFECDRKCVPASWRCDGDRDCADGTDELNCSYRPGCGPDRFRCADGFGCIPKRWVCDGKAECRDGSDEMSCSQKECTQGDFKCDNGICIPGIWVCDGQDDCKDNSDERSCSAPPSNMQAVGSAPSPVVVPAPVSYQSSSSSSSSAPQSYHQQQQSYMPPPQPAPIQQSAQPRYDSHGPSANSYYTASSGYTYGGAGFTASPSGTSSKVSPASLAQQQAPPAPAPASRYISYSARSSPPIYAAVTRPASYVGTGPSFQSSFSPGALYRRISHVHPINHPFFGHSNHHVYRYHFYSKK